MKFKKLRMIIIEANKTLDNPLRHLRENNHVQAISGSTNNNPQRELLQHSTNLSDTIKTFR